MRVHLNTGELNTSREPQLATLANAQPGMGEGTAVMPDDLAYARAGNVAPRSRAVGVRVGLELGRCAHAQRTGARPTLVQRTAAKLLAPGWAAAAVEIQFALFQHAEEQLRDAAAPGHPVGGAARHCTPRGSSHIVRPAGWAAWGR